MVNKLAKKLDTELQMKIENAFDKNKDLKRQEEIKQRDEGSKQVVMSQVQEMHKKFEGFEKL
jgi:hypothetical protein